MSNDITINAETKNNRVNKLTKMYLIHLEFTLQYITYLLLYYKEHIHMTSNESTTNVEKIIE